MGWWIGDSGRGWNRAVIKCLRSVLKLGDPVQVEHEVQLEGYCRPLDGAFWSSSLSVMARAGRQASKFSSIIVGNVVAWNRQSNAAGRPWSSHL